MLPQSTSQVIRLHKWYYYLVNSKPQIKFKIHKARNTGCNAAHSANKNEKNKIWRYVYSLQMHYTFIINTALRHRNCLNLSFPKLIYDLILMIRFHTTPIQATVMIDKILEKGIAGIAQLHVHCTVRNELRQIHNVVNTGHGNMDAIQHISFQGKYQTLHNHIPFVCVIH